MILPDYQGGGIVNLMSSIKQAFGGKSIYPGLNDTKINFGPKVVLLVLDGMGYNFLAKHPGSFLYKNLKGKLTSVFPSSTTSATTALMTGLAPAQHGLTGWHLYLEELGRIVKSLPFTSPDGEIFLKEQGFKFPEIYEQKSFYEELLVDSYAIVKSNFVNSAFSQTAQKGAKFISFETFDEMLEKIQKLSIQKDSFYAYAYWDQMDFKAHRAGINSQEIGEYFQEIDKKLEGLADDLKKENVTLIVTADHGLIDTRYLEIGEIKEIADCLRLPLCGEMRFA